MTKSRGSLPLARARGWVRMRSPARERRYCLAGYDKTAVAIHFAVIRAVRSSLFWCVRAVGGSWYAILPCPEFDPGRFPAPIQETCLLPEQRGTSGELYHTRRRFRATLERWPHGQLRAYTRQCGYSPCAPPHSARRRRRRFPLRREAVH